MRFLSAAILSISLTLAPAIASEPKPAAKAEKKKPGRGKSFLRAIGSFGGGMLLADPYQEVNRSKKKARGTSEQR